MLDLVCKCTRKFLNSFAILPYIFQDNHFKIFKIKEDVTNNTFIYVHIQYGKSGKHSYPKSQMFINYTTYF